MVLRRLHHSGTCGDHRNDPHLPRLAASETVSRFGSANAEYIKGFTGVDNETGQRLAKGLADIARFVQAGLDDARRRGLDGIVCGHIHRASLLQRDGLLYANDGDWVESLTALSEEADGTLCLLSHTGKVLGEVAPRLRLVPQDAQRAA